MPDSPRFDALLATERSISAAGADLEKVLTAVVDQGLSVIPNADGAIVQMYDAGKLVYRAASGAAQSLVGRRIGIAESFAGRSLLTGVPLICRDIENENLIDLSPYRDAHMRALMAVPLVQRGRSIGALKFYSSEPGTFAQRDLTAAELIASHLASGLLGLMDDDATHGWRQGAARLQAMTEALPQLIWTMTSAGELTYANRNMVSALDIDTRTSIGKSLLSMVDRRCRTDVLEQWQSAQEQRRPFSFECRVQVRGEPRWTLIHISPVLAQADHEISEWIGAATDIDDHKATEIDLQEAVRTRELLLHEANHRTKNSLQMVTGLLALHASRITHSEARARMLEARAQIGTIARVHQSIYQASQQNRIELARLLRDLAESLVGRNAQRRAELHFSAPETLFLPIEQGVPVALIAGEIITNAVKHATGRPGSMISVNVTANDNMCVVDIADNGPGLPPESTLKQSGGLGMEIIFGLSKQTGGSVEIDRDHPGARLRLVVPLGR